MNGPTSTIVCVDCGGTAHLLNERRPDPETPDETLWEPGDVATYRCADCLDRWDLVLAEEDFDDESG